MLRVLMPRFYVLVGILTTGAVALLLDARSRDDTPATISWYVGSALGVAMLGAPIVIRGLIRRVRPASRRGRHAER